MTTIEGYALSPQQERIWRQQQAHGLLRRAMILKALGPLDVDRLGTCLRELVRRHEILRTRFVVPEFRKHPLQIVGEDPFFSWTTRDANPMECHAERLLSDALERALDLKKGPVLHVELLRLCETEHWLVCCLPTLCCDAWSMYEIARQLVELYDGSKDPEEEEWVQYSHYARWLEDLREDSEAGRLFWEEQHRDAPPNPNPSTKTSGSPARWLVSINPELGASLQRAAAALEVSPQTLVLAIWRIFLNHQQAGPHGVLATSFHGRSFQNLEGALGPFSRFLPVNIRLNDAGPLYRAVAACKETLRQADEMQHFYNLDPLPDLIPDHAFEWESDPTPMEGGGLCWEVLGHQHQRETFRLHLSLSMRGEEPVQFCFSSRKTGDVDGGLSFLANRFLTLMKSALSSTESPICRLQTVGTVHKHQLLVELNDTREEPQSPGGFLNMFRRQVRTSGDCVALVAGTGRGQVRYLSYDRLHGRVSAVAGQLRALGVSRDQIVAICLQRTPSLVTAILGIQAAGAAYLALDPQLPGDRLAMLLEDSSTRILITDLRHDWIPLDVTILRPDSPLIESHPKPLPPFPPPMQLAYLVYTSGSTGKPKAVMVTHENLNRYLHGIRRRLGLDRYPSFAHVSTLAADLGNTVFFPPLCHGATLYLVPEHSLADAHAFAAFFQRHSIACLKITPSHLSSLMHHPRPGEVLPRKCLILGGEACQWELLERIRHLAPSLAIHNHYGPSESTIGVLTYAYAGERVAEVPPLGNPLPNCRTYLINNNLDPVAGGRTGELAIAGGQLAMGYRQRPEITASRFLPDPFAAVAGTRLYRTGDLAAWAGYRLVFKGRSDDQIKIRGYRIEPGEIEVVLKSHHAVSRASTWVDKSEKEPLLVVFFTLASGYEPAENWAAELRRFLLSKLPTYMIPNHFQFLPSLPLTPNGKIDRQALARHASEIRYHAQTEQTAASQPANETETLLLEMWREILKKDGLGTRDNFFDRGGHSLSGTVLISRVNESFGLNLPLSALFEEPTIRGLAHRIHLVRLHSANPSQLARVLNAAGMAKKQALDELSRERLAEVFQKLDPAGYPREKIPALPRREPETVFPLSHAQQRLWFMSQMQGIDTTYSRATAYRLVGGLHTSALAKSLAGMVARHETLRTTFFQQNGMPNQRVLAPDPDGKDAVLPVIDLSTIALNDGNAHARKLIDLESRRPFNLEKGPLCRFVLIHLDRANHHLIFNIHHIVSDGWSIGVMFGEFKKFYTAYLHGVSPTLPVLPIQYADYAAWQRKRLTDDVFERHLDYWRGHLRGAPPLLQLPTDRPRPAVQSFRGNVFRTHWDAGITARLKHLARHNDTTLFMVLHACFSALLSVYSGQQDIVVGTPVANRIRPELELLIGFFVNTLVLRLEVVAQDSLQDLIARAREEALAAFQHQEIPFEQIVETLLPNRSPGYHPLFQVSLALQNAAPNEETRLPGIQLETWGAEHTHAHIDLILFVAEQDRALLCGFQYNTDLFDVATMERMARHLTILVANAGREPQQSLARMSWLTEREHDLVLRIWNRNQTQTPKWLVHQGFEAQAARRPDATAVVLYPPHTRQVTYGVLAAHAEALARNLETRGCRNKVVAVHSPRSPDMIAALLGIIKAGAAYLPLDTELPKQRRTFMLADSAAAAMVVVGPNPYLGKWPVMRLQHAPSEKVTRHDRPPPEPGGLAYVIYTSGSTGKPKGVMVPHKSLSNAIQSDVQVFGLEPRSRVLHFVSLSFDAATSHIFMAICAGATLCQVDGLPSELVEHIKRVLQNQRVSHAAFPASVLEAIGQLEVPALRLLISGAEACSPEMVARWARGRRFFNVYGPTETTITATTARCHARNSGKPFIGRPITNLQAFVVNPLLKPLPIGIAGELLIGGVGLAWGYLGRPDLTAMRFVPDPFVSDHGQTGAGCRLYRSGDRARLHAGGPIEFLGRLDRQVKMRGYRIELGEIEALLAKNPAVREQAVVFHEGRAPEAKMIAYVVADSNTASRTASPAQEEAQMVSQWEQIYTDEYGIEETRPDPAPNFEGWNDSYTGQPIPTSEMLAWLEGVVNRILTTRPQYVLEVGCGLGNILFKIAPHVTRYVATDLSPGSIRFVSQRLKAQGANLPVALRQGPADDFSGLEAQRFDTVICNSVIQYFPGLDYLHKVLENAVKLTAPGGTIFVGDVRCLPLEPHFQYSVLLKQVPAWTRVSQLKQQAEERALKELELMVDPAFFRSLPLSLPRIGRVRILLKKETNRNELTRFRYDVLLQLKPAVDKIAVPIEIDWGATAPELDAIRDRLQTRTTGLRLRHIPNSRIQQETRLLQSLETLDEDLTLEQWQKKAAGLPQERFMEPEVFWKLAENLPYEVEVTWSDKPSCYDVVFRPLDGSAEPGHPGLAWAPETPRAIPLSNQPLRGKRLREFLSQLHRDLRSELPDHMIPHHVVLRSHMPLTPSGKIDRKALPMPLDLAGSTGEAYKPPETEDEQKMAAIWSEVLARPHVGIHDNFFNLGGHSLVATRVNSRIREVFGVKLPLQALFTSPTIAGLCSILAEARRQARVASGIVPASRSSRLPLSFSQQRLWFLDHLEGPNATYNIPSALRFQGALDVGALEAAVRKIIERHEVLRTTFPTREGEAYQEIQSEDGLAKQLLRVSDFRDIGEVGRTNLLQGLIRDESRKPFNLTRGPLLRLLLVLAEARDYILIATMHHIISDGWSVGILIQELSAIYRGHLNHEPPTLPVLTVQYADYAAWQHQNSGEMETQLAYWKTQLEDLPELLHLPLDRPRPAVQTFRGGNEPFRLEGPILERFSDLCRRTQTTLFMGLEAVLAVLLSRYSGQGEVAVGTPVAGRNRKELEPLIGLFINTLVLRNDLRDNPTFIGLLDRTRQVALQAFSHQDVPFERVVEVLQPTRSLNHSPMFQVLFSLQNMPMERLDLEGVALAPLSTENAFARFDLTLSIAETPPGLTGFMNFNTDLFHRDTVRRLLDHYRRLLIGVSEQAGTPVAGLPILSQEERHRFLYERDEFVTTPSPERRVETLIEMSTYRAPDAIAFQVPGRVPDRDIGPDRFVTYSQGLTRAYHLAGHLVEGGLQPGEFVGLYSDRSPNMIWALWGILLAGGAYLPLDPTYPPERVRFMLDDAGVRLLVTHQPLAGYLPTHLQVVTLEEIVQIKGAATPTITHRDRRQPAYIIYTSGSTGLPKGVVIGHDAFHIFLANMRNLLSMDSRSVWLAVTTISFDIAALELFLPAVAGGRIVLADRETATDPNALARLAERVGATVMQATPATWSSLRSVTWQGSARLNILCGGEALPVDLAAWLLPKGASLWNLYGPTEATIWAGALSLTPSTGPRRSEGEPIPIGPPLRHYRFYVLDPYMEPQPFGATGELFIGGLCLAQGYHGRPRLTAEKFIPNPFVSPGGQAPENLQMAGGRLYQTGDLAAYHADGTIAFRGRIDHQIKLRGHRIELGEIEFLLRRHPYVVEALVDLGGQGNNETVTRFLIAYVVPTPEGVAAHSSNRLKPELLEYLAQYLPPYATPSVLMCLESMPRLPSGKIDRRALPSPQHATLSKETPPDNAMELRLLTIWEEILPNVPVGTNDNFFQLGGHSVLAVRLMARIQKDLGLSLPLSSLFRAPTVRQLARVLLEGPKAGFTPLVPIQPRGKRPTLFAVHGAGGGVLFYRQFLAYLDADQPLWALEAQGTDGKHEPLADVEEMATNYMEAVLERQPEGPYLLGGFSVGGCVAYEMALRLHHAGKRVALLALFDTVAHENPEFDLAREQAEEPEQLLGLLSRLGQNLGKQVPPPPKLHAGKTSKAHVEAVLTWAQSAGMLPAEFEKRRLHQQWSVFRNNIWAYRRYRFQPYPGRLTLFRSMEQDPRGTLSPFRGWERYLSEDRIEVHDVPGNHDTLILEPNLPYLCQKLNQCLVRALEEEPGDA